MVFLNAILMKTVFNFTSNRVNMMWGTIIVLDDENQDDCSRTKRVAYICGYAGERNYFYSR